MEAFDSFLVLLPQEPPSARATHVNLQNAEALADQLTAKFRGVKRTGSLWHAWMLPCYTNRY